MQIAIDVAGFSATEADQLRKAMGSKRSVERMAALKDRLLDGMAERGIDRETGEAIYAKLQAFSDFGFPESHSFSFAYLVYASSWLKVHHPEAFYASILASQPMGFYSPQTLVADAQRHGVRVLPVEINRSEVQPCVEDRPVGGWPEDSDDDDDARPPSDSHRWSESRSSSGSRSSSAEPSRPAADEGSTGRPRGDSVVPALRALVEPDPRLAVRLGLAQVRGIGEEVAEQIVAERERGGGFISVEDLASRVALSRAQLEALATANALRAWGSRRENLWRAGALDQEHGSIHRSGTAVWIQPPLPGTAVGANPPRLPAMGREEEAVADVWATGTTTSAYPTFYVRESLEEAGVVRIGDLAGRLHGERLRVGGVVTHRQRPHTAAGITFLSLEDETGLLNVVCSKGLWKRYRRLARTSAALVIRGTLERADGVMNLVADGMEYLSLKVPSRSRDFR